MCLCMHMKLHLFAVEWQISSPFLCGHFGFVHFYHINISYRLQEKENKDKKSTSVNILYNFRNEYNEPLPCVPNKIQVNSLCCNLRL